MKSTEVGSEQMKEPFVRESPEYIRTSLAAAMTMKKLPGKLYRDAKLYCINLLLTYEDGCHGRCAYCGLSDSRQTETDWIDNSFIRVDWPVMNLDDIKETLIDNTCPHVERVCVSMITRAKARDDCITVVSELKKVIPRISVLITPTIVNRAWLEAVKAAGADMVGIAIDAATPALFEELRGNGVKGPHKWTKYWMILEEAVSVFGKFNAGIHLIVGLGETEEEIISVIQKAHDMGANTHLFSFFPEEGSKMENEPQPPIGTYRRVQLARYLINKEVGSFENMTFNEEGQLVSFGVDSSELDQIIRDGAAFMTSGCRGKTMDNACNRPFGNCTPFQASIGHWRNFPIIPDQEDISKIRDQLNDYSETYEVDDKHFD